MSGDPSARWLLHIPKGYVDLLSPRNVFPDVDGKKYFFACRIKAMRGFSKSGTSTSMWRDMSRLLIEMEDARGNTAKCMAFGAVWCWKKFAVGSEVLLYAKTSYWNDYLNIDQPEIISVEQTGRVHARYSNCSVDGKSYTGDDVRRGVQDSFPLIDEAVRIILDDLKMDEEDFESKFEVTPQNLLRALHFPSQVIAGMEAILQIEDLVIEIMARRAERNAVAVRDKRSAIVIDQLVVEHLLASVSSILTLTGDQKAAITEIIDDLRSDFPMRRMLSGDVGTGKSLVFMLPAAAAVLAGRSCAIITPNQLLVSQIASGMATFFPDVPVQVMRDGADIVSGGGLVIGTTSVIFAAQRGKHSFDFVITDEEHKFSVDQKFAVVNSFTNLLKATATPIPRSVALILCNGMKLSVLEQCPVKKNINSFMLGADKKSDLLSFVRKMTQEGQVAVVYPAVSSSDTVKSIDENASKWEKLFPGQVAVIHGQMPDAEKQKALDDMLYGRRRILVATTVIEVGVNLPDLKFMLVVNPEMFGASQLHQLRGRVARHGGEGYFAMYCPSEIPEESAKRLELVKKNNNGFDLAEKDMRSRGFGDLDSSGETQTGQGKLVFNGLKLNVDRLIAALSVR